MNINKESLLKNLKYDFDIQIYDTVASTNNLLKELAANGANEGTVVIASHQTAGRGRMGRKFYSPSDSGIYLSLLLRPDILAKDALSLTTMAAVAVANGIDKVSEKEALIKWVNDIYIDNKKVCGILAEASFNSDGAHLDFVVLGIGINITPPKGGFPEDLQDIATSVFDNDDINSKKELLISEVLNNFMDLYKNDINKNYIGNYISKSFILGNHIIVLDGDSEKEAIALDIDKECRLKVRYTDNTEEWLSFGEVSTKIKK